jgi:hypothetical protein
MLAVLQQHAAGNMPVHVGFVAAGGDAH